MSSLVYEFNQTQRKASLDTISSQTPLSWLKAERPKTAIYPHQSDYCDYCSKKKSGHSKMHPKHQQALVKWQWFHWGFWRTQKKKEDLQNDMEEHRKIARESLQYYCHFKERCNKQWCKMLSLSHPVVVLKEIKSFSSFRTPSLCYWVLTIKCPSSFLTGDTVLSQVRHITYKRCRMISMVLSTTEMEVATYTSWMKLLVPRILIIPSHTLCTIWSLLVKFLAGSEESMSSWTMLAQRIKINIWWMLHLKLYNKE